MVFIALDYDGTYTADPALWDAFIRAAQKQGHTVGCVTWRRNNAVEAPVVHKLGQRHNMPLFFTGRKAKLQFMADQGIQVDIWIDDRPDAILADEVVPGVYKPPAQQGWQFQPACCIQ